MTDTGQRPGLQPWPPPYSGAYGPPPWAPPPRRRRSRWLTVGLPLGALLVLGGAATLAFLAFNAVTGTLGPAKQAAESYATALVEQRWDDAHAMLCDETRAGITPDDLADLYGDPPLAEYTLTGIHVNSSGGRTTGQATLTFVTETGLDVPTFVTLENHGEDWLPCP